MILDLVRLFRDWSRGFTDQDIRSLQRRLQELSACTDGATIWLTPGETMALSRGRVIGVWRISTLSVINGRALVCLRPMANAGV